MQAAASIIARLRAAGVRRRAPLWVAVIAPWCLLLSPVGVAVCGAWIWWDYRRLDARIRQQWSSWLDASVPALEDSSARLEKADGPLARLQRARLLARIDSILRDDVIASIAAERTGFDLRIAAASAAAALALWGWGQFEGQPVTARAVLARLAAQAIDVTVRITPPRHTGLARFESKPRDLEVPEHSIVEWCLPAPQPAGSAVELSDGQRLAIGARCARWSATESVFWRWNGMRHTLKVLPDQAPLITFAAPREMVHTLATGAVQAGIAVTVRDDYMVRRASLHLTLARGSGENVRFSGREVALPASNDPRTRAWSRQWSLAELGMEPGDELYFFVRAFDNAVQPNASVSPTYTLRLPGPALASLDAAALPTLGGVESLRSQRQIIIDTEQLLAETVAGKLDAEAQRSRSEAIAADQGALRRRYGQYLGEESTLFEDGHEEYTEEPPVEAAVEAAVEAEYGHTHDDGENATLFDPATKVVLRRALAAMWDAEKALRAIRPKAALAPEHRALAAVKQLQQAERIYLHKTAFTPPPLDQARRLSGELDGAASVRLAQRSPSEVLPADVQGLMAALAGGGKLPPKWQPIAQGWIRSRISADAQRHARGVHLARRHQRRARQPQLLPVPGTLADERKHGTQPWRRTGGTQRRGDPEIRPRHAAIAAVRWLIP